MAYLQNGGQFEVETERDLHQFLEKQGVYYERLEENHTPKFFEKKLVLSEDEKLELLHVYKDFIADFATRRGYEKWDIAILSEQTPDMLKKFGSLHYHLEDEVRIVVGGGGIFTIHSHDGSGYFELKAIAGDVVVVPANRAHAFRLSDHLQFIVVRLFEGEASSITFPVDDPAFIVK
ncbi:acireductone dioxygenase [Paenibacillus sp. GSMTC-2017]|uniref:acireductone dioxygenase n=1 Tax=Paenibacillus sp. GSMTC-2017 TaxID=2794350 RepID=UPI0018D77AF0|nr:acireductone dioxygenase [Paenibacillus sp. GSMTC-2017]MBH5318738.1 acireductone dioxygenase [Paenibacillus sp. GSMTC-2017]